MTWCAIWTGRWGGRPGPANPNLALSSGAGCRRRIRSDASQLRGPTKRRGARDGWTDADGTAEPRRVPRGRATRPAPTQGGSGSFDERKGGERVSRRPGRQNRNTVPATRLNAPWSTPRSTGPLSLATVTSGWLLAWSRCDTLCTAATPGLSASTKAAFGNWRTKAWLSPVMPTRRRCASRWTMRRAPVKVLPAPGGPCTAK